MGEPGRSVGPMGNDGRPLACVDCLGPATIQVLSPEGFPAGTFCDEDWQAREACGRAVNKMLANAISDWESPGPGDNGYREGLDAAIRCLALLEEVRQPEAGTGGQ